MYVIINRLTNEVLVASFTSNIHHYNDEYFEIFVADPELVEFIKKGKEIIFNSDTSAVELKYPMKEQELELKITNLEQENLNIMLATTEMYEEQYNENLNLMLAITELYEMMEV